MREITAGAWLRGTRAASTMTPSILKRTVRVPSSAGAKWMSETERSTASEMIERTSLIVGASSGLSNWVASSAVSTGSVSSSMTSPSSTLNRLSRTSRSSCETTTASICMPVNMDMSSSAR